uniref:Zinc finger protein RFP-like n=1 Tax=Chelonoidis abingdonii TaxID=106734 RepID=A0A8C0GXM4_CHEAB
MNGAMATDNPVESLREEATCPICLEYFKDPVIIECGHNFCRACIAQCWEGSDTAASCPQCRETVQQRNLRPNRQLANVVEIAKRLNLQAAKEAGGERVCGEHKETLKLFCEEDQTSICLVCHLSRAHRAHRVVPLEEAAQEYKAPPMSLTSPCPIFIQKQTQTERQKIVSEFQRLRQFLEEQERLLLAQLEKLDEEIVRIQNENWGKDQMVSRTLYAGLAQHSLEEGDSLSHSPAGADSVTDTIKPSPRTNLLNVTLDPDTAYPELILSEDRKRVRCGDTWQDLPDNPERFDSRACVLGCEGFTSGRHYWEVEVGDGKYWAVGVARESMRRKGEIRCCPEDGIWAVERQDNQCQVLTTPEPTLLSRVPSRIRVCLDCEWGQVTFIDAGHEAPIFTFPPGSFKEERIRPFVCCSWCLHQTCCSGTIALVQLPRCSAVRVNVP